MSKAQLKLGDQVHVTVHPGQNNGSSVAAAQVVRVLNTEDATRVNLRVMLDGDETLLLRNVPLLTKKEAEENEDTGAYCWKP